MAKENDFDRAEAQLRAFAQLKVNEQRLHKDEIVRAFDIFWRSNPSQVKFGAVCGSLVLFSEMLWTLAKVK